MGKAYLRAKALVVCKAMRPEPEGSGYLTVAGGEMLRNRQSEGWLIAVMAVDGVMVVGNEAEPEGSGYLTVAGGDAPEQAIRGLAGCRDGGRWGGGGGRGRRSGR